SAALALDDVTKHFAATRALDGASLHVARGSLHALLGENGAGKTTLARVAFGLVHPDAGTVAVDGVPRAIPTPRAAIALGIGMVHQHYTLVPAFTVAENVALGGRGPFHRAHAAERVRRLAEDTGLAVDPMRPVATLSVAGQQRVEILKALARGARVLLLDEPTAVLAPAEAEELLSWLRRFVAAGNTALLVTHKLDEAMRYADQVTVLRHGRTVLAAPTAAITSDALVRAMLGASGIPDDTPAPAPHPGAPVLEAHALRVRDAAGVERVRDATFTVRAGELVALAGVEGAGQHELLRALAGRLPPAGGTLRRPREVGFVPEDRQRDALVLELPLTENVALRGAGARRGLMPWRALRAHTAALLAAHDVRARGPDAPAGALSGGNQQKLVLARELDGEPPVLVVENPTRGLDVRATAAVHARLRTARDRGAAVLVHSVDLDELLLLADRVLVMHAGTVHAVERERGAIGRAMLGVGGGP
ncbi:MAG TPA: ATP-binding cassette domain-containing protein, partial [Gemmatimonadaceae bacterium]|nr:ATP-binding cassette domain-containing protein [Gemmatimonadaceae bacterium]